MKLHTDNLDVSDVIAAAGHASGVSGALVSVETATLHGSRSRLRAIDVKLLGDGTLQRRRNATNTGYAATWDQWGHFFAYLFAIDPGMTCATYRDSDHFHTLTDDRFRISAVSR